MGKEEIRKEGREREGMGREGKWREGKGGEGNGGEGKGMERKGREGKVGMADNFPWHWFFRQYDGFSEVWATSLHCSLEQITTLHSGILKLGWQMLPCIFIRRQTTGSKIDHASDKASDKVIDSILW